MTTIKLKNGSGAPAGGDLVQGEPALDLTNKRLYTENASGTVIEVGTNPTSVTTGDVVATSLDISGNIDVDGTTNLDVVDIDGAVDMASTLAVGGVVTANAGVVVDNITIDGQEIDVSSGDLTLDVAGDIILDADGGDVILKDGGTEFMAFYNGTIGRTGDLTLDASGDIILDADDEGKVNFKDGGTQYARIDNNGGTGLDVVSTLSDGDIRFRGNDGGSTIAALTLDMSAAGAATFNSTVTSTAFGSQLATTSFVQNAITTTVGSSSGAFIRMAVSNASNPTYAFDGDTDTGMFTSGSNTLNFSTASTERMRIDSSGNVGIGTSSLTGGNTILNLSRTGSGVGCNMQFANSHNSAFYVGLAGNTSGDAILHSADGTAGMAFGTGNTERMRIRSDGTVQFGSGSVNSAYVLGSAPNTYNSGWDVNDDSFATWLNYSGYQGGTTRYRDLIVGDGKNGRIATFDGSSGNVGIGTTSPAGALHVFNSSAGEQFISSSNSAMRFVSTGGANYIQSGTATSSSSAADLIFTNVGGSGETMRIDSSGNLLVGKTSAGSSVVGQELRANGYNVFTRDGDTPLELYRKTSDGSLLNFTKDGTTVGSIGCNGAAIHLASGTTGIRVISDNTIRPSDASGAFKDNAIDLGAANARWKDLYLSGSVKVPAASKGIEYSSTSFITPENNTSGAEISTAGTLTVKTGSTPSLAMTVDGSGNLLVGTTDNSVLDNTTGNGINLKASGDVQIAIDSGEALYLNRMGTDGRVVNFRKAGSFVAGIDVTSTTVTYNTSSDQRLKDNIVDAPSASDDIDAIQVRSFDWKADGSHQKYGMVAQELNTVAPEAVSTPEDPEEMMGVDYSKLVPMLVKEIQSLRARVAQLETN